jgi:hypothetical protein
MRIFLSYSRSDETAAQELQRDLEELGHDVWRDDKVNSGERWWESILTQIRERDVFVLALSQRSAQSEACLKELGWAVALRRAILTISVGAEDQNNPQELLPAHVAAIHTLAYKPGRSREDLEEGLGRMKLAQLPAPLPTPPDMPRSRLNRLTELVACQELDTAQQERLLLDLQREARKPAAAANARHLLERLRERADVRNHIATAIDNLPDHDRLGQLRAVAASPRARVAAFIIISLLLCGLAFGVRFPVRTYLRFAGTPRIPLTSPEQHHVPDLSFAALIHSLAQSLFSIEVVIPVLLALAFGLLLVLTVRTTCVATFIPSFFQLLSLTASIYILPSLAVSEGLSNLLATPPPPAQLANGRSGIPGSAKRAQALYRAVYVHDDVSDTPTDHASQAAAAAAPPCRLTGFGAELRQRYARCVLWVSLSAILLVFGLWGRALSRRPQGRATFTTARFTRHFLNLAVSALLLLAFLFALAIQWLLLATFGAFIGVAELTEQHREQWSTLSQYRTAQQDIFRKELRENFPFCVMQLPKYVDLRHHLEVRNFFPLSTKYRVALVFIKVPPEREDAPPAHGKVEHAAKIESLSCQTTRLLGTDATECTFTLETPPIQAISTAREGWITLNITVDNLLHELVDRGEFPPSTCLRRITVLNMGSAAIHARECRPTGSP